MNSKAYDNRKKSVEGRTCWTGSVLIMEVDVIGRRRVLGIERKEEFRSVDGFHGLVRNCVRVSWVWALTS